MPTRREFVRTAGAAGACAAVSPRLSWIEANVGLSADASAKAEFRGTICFFSKHLPDLDGRAMARALKPLGFAGIDLTVRPKGHVEPARVRESLPVFVTGIREEGLQVPMITTDLHAGDEPAAAATLETAAALKIPFFKPGYYYYAFADVRKELAEASAKLRSLAALSVKHRVRLGFHNHAGYVGGGVWDIAPTIDALAPEWRDWVGYYFDVRHAVVEGGDGGWRSAFNLAAPRLQMIALKDFYWEKNASGAWRQQNCPIGEGMVPWKPFFAALARSGFNGPVSLHLEYDIPGATAAAVQENTLAAAARDLAFVKKGLAEAYGASLP
jgi:sugar phosphate isomerase/epimerase